MCILDNRLTDGKSQSNQLRSDLLTLQTDTYHSEKQSEGAKAVIQHKRQMLY